MRSRTRTRAEVTSLDVRGNRTWHAAWPSHVPLTLDYPKAPAWWLLERSATSFGARPALRELDPATGAERRALTYEALFRAARGAANGFQRLGLRPGARIGFVLPNSSALICGYYATWLAGGVVVPANPAAPERELHPHLADAGVEVVVGESGTAAERVAARINRTFLAIQAFEELAALPPIADPADSVDDLAVLLYTGGTTGTPKGVMLTHRNLVVNTIQFAEWYAFAAGEETCVSAIPIFHSGGMAGAMNVPLYSGATLLVFDRFRPAAVAHAVTSYRATRLFGVPTMFIALLNDADARRADYSHLKACRTNAAALSPAVKIAFDGLVGREVLVEGYGLTEASPLTHANPIGCARPGSIGIPLPDTDARIVDLKTRRECPVGRAGELLVRGPQVMRGYWNQPVKTAAALTDGWLHTGDVAVMEPDGYFSIVSRTTDVINTGGFKVWPREVEDVLYTHPAVRQVGVLGIPDDYRGEVVKACVVLKEEHRGRVTGEELRQFCRERLTPYKTPRVVELRAELPMTASGKLRREQLAAPPDDEPERPR
jgi:long-chain acyl-CoA synthetase